MGHHYSMYLFARPSFFEGVGRIFDLRNALSMYNFSESPEQADQIALECDWQAVGQELRRAVRECSAGVKQVQSKAKTPGVASAG